MEILKRQAYERTTHTSKRKLSHSSTKSSKPSRNDLQQLQRNIFDQIKKLSTDDEKKDEKSTLIFIESVLKWEFGQDFIQDPLFSELVREVNTILQNEQNLHQKLNKLFNSD